MAGTIAATKPYHRRIAVVFDFDLTLAPDSFNALLARCGVGDPDAWRREHIQPLVRDGWDTILARIYGLVELSRSGKGGRITRELCEEVGRGIEPYNGVLELFGRLRRRAHEILPEIEVEFYLLSSGFIDVQRAVAFAREFKDVWGTEFYFGAEDGGMAFAKQVLTHPEKVHYMLALSKGTGVGGANEPADAYRPVPEADLYVPLDQMIYVGDGGSDMPVFDLLNEHGGIALAVFKSERAQDWSGYEQMRPGRRVENLAPANFRGGSELMRSLDLAVEAVAKRVALRRLGRGK